MDSPPPSASLEPVSLHQYTWPNNDDTIEEPRQAWSYFVAAFSVLGFVLVVFCISRRRRSRRNRASLVLAPRFRFPVPSAATTAIRRSSSSSEKEEDEETEPAPGEDAETEHAPGEHDETEIGEGGGDSQFS